MTDDDKKAPQHLSSNRPAFFWNWGKENPPEIVLVAFILILFFALPRPGCGIEKTDGERIPTAFNQSAAESPEDAAPQP